MTASVRGLALVRPPAGVPASTWLAQGEWLGDVEVLPGVPYAYVHDPDAFTAWARTVQAAAVADCGHVDRRWERQVREQVAQIGRWIDGTGRDQPVPGVRTAHALPTIRVTGPDIPTWASPLLITEHEGLAHA